MDTHPHAVRRRALPSIGPSASVVLSVAAFVAGFGALTLPDRGLPPAAVVLVLAAAVAMAAALLVVMWLVAALEAASGRAWAAGFRRLRPAERSPAGVLGRGLRYAAVLWGANGAALWVAALLGWGGA